MGPTAPLALYVHLPFCRRRCLYCDFTAFQDPGAAERRDYHEALLVDLHREARRVSGPVGTVFLGGGTPSLAPPEWIGEILAACRREFSLTEGAEISMEANPGTVTREDLRRLREAGVNRLSFGVQALQDRLLAGIGRIHSVREALEAVAWAREAGFDNLNLDLIYGLPGQEPADWEATVERALDLTPEHLAAYALIVEEGTPLEARLRTGELRLPDEDAVADMEALLRQRMRRRGYRQYEISNWSLPGRQCRHNLVYWANGEYLGLGCGAVSFLGGWRIRRLEGYQEYLERVRQGDWPVADAERLGREAAVKETLILALRTRWGAHLGRVGRRHQIPAARLLEFFDSLPGGLIQRRGARVRLTARGRDLANEVFVRLLQTALSTGSSDAAAGLS